ncbi:MAG: Serine/threonine-protein kinase [Icmadophila ericetorum]|nr:Serine/threonine-protein kinase [Icmadophila ericetorum]
MGQSVSITALSAGSAGIDVEKLSDLTYEKSLGTARFMKCIRARHLHGLVVVKIVMKPFPDFDLEPYIKAIRQERELLADVPNALGYQKLVKTDISGYLVRQYLYSSLYDRMSTRPFLEDIEKKWLAFQLLCAVRDSHARNVYHGDIKTENILVTSWNWLYLTDFSSSFKRTYLPEDNPADFSYFFDTSGRRTCYVAPERFLGAGEKEDSRGVTWAMDIFSVGCVIAELFLEAPIFSLSQLFKYRKGEYDPEIGHLSKIEDKDIRELVTHMIQLEPESRYSAEEYLNFWRRKAFPEYFYTFLHEYMSVITDPAAGKSPVMPDTTHFGEADERIDRVYNEFDKISYFLGYDRDRIEASSTATSGDFANEVVPFQIEIPNNRHTATSAGKRPGDDGTLIFLTLVVSSLRNTARSTSRLHACDLMLAFAERITDEAKLDRILPYVVSLLNDRAEIVRMAALRTTTQLLSLVKVVSPVNAHVFTEYLRPRLQNLIQVAGRKEKAAALRATYATCLGALAHTSSSISDMVQALRADGSIPSIDPEAEDGAATDAAYQNLFDVARQDLVEHFEIHTKALLTDPNPSVQRAVLSSVSQLCVFFGTSKANDVVLSHLNTYLNERDWMLKCAFFHTIVGVATFIGGSSLEDFVLPLMLQALTDPEDCVVEKVLTSFATIAELGLFQRSKTWEMVDVVARFMMHPNIWIREAAVHFVSSATIFLSPADTYCTIMPLVLPYLKTSIQDFSETSILDALKRPLSRPALEMAATWALKVEKGIFWRHIQQQRTFSFGAPEQALQTISSRDLTPNALRKMPKNDEDEHWLTRLHNIGMVEEDEFKLLALRDYIGRMAVKKPKEPAVAPNSDVNGILRLEDMRVTPNTIFFGTLQKQEQGRRVTSRAETKTQEARKAPHTIADALLDASTSIDDSLAQQKKSRVNTPSDQHYDEIPSLALPVGFREARGASSNVPSPLSSSPSSVTQTALPSGASTRRASAIPLGLASRNTARDGTLTSDSLRTGSIRDPSPSIGHRSSAINLLSRRDTPKTLAETGTTPTNVSGMMDGLPTPNGQTEGSEAISNQSKKRSTAVRPDGSHTYDGNDPNVKKFFDNLAVENLASDLIDYGPTVTPVTGLRALRKPNAQGVDMPWRPQGILVATFGEHTGAINRVVPSPDHLFFLTASDDGSIKVWDTGRLERNLGYRSRHTYKHLEGSQVKTITFIENTHTFVSCATDGSIHVVKVDVTVTGDTAKYGKLRLLREHQLHEGEYAVWSEHFKSDAKSVLIIATNTSRIIAIDLRKMTVMYIFENPVHHGTPACFCIDRRHNWLLLGTSHGVLDIWDLRFHLRIKAYGIAGGTPIHRIQIHPFKGRGKWVCIAGGTKGSEITVWDVEKGQCREIYRANGTSDGSTKENLRLYDLVKVDEDKPENMLNRFATALELQSKGNEATGLNNIRAITIGLDAPDDGRDAKYGFFITGGPDRKVRFWDLTRVEASNIVNGLDSEEPRAKYVATYSTTSLTFNIEQVPPSPIAAGGTTGGAGGGGKREANTAAKRSSARPPRSTVISKQQQQLLRMHLDMILDVAFLESPVGMTVSVDRAGGIYVFQ